VAVVPLRDSAGSGNSARSLSRNEKFTTHIMSTALITGVNGQDGSYLAELLLSKGYQVVGSVRDKTTNLERVVHLRQRIEIVALDLNDRAAIENVLHEFRPYEVYNLAARASGTELWNEPVITGEVNALSVTRLLEAIRNFNIDTRFCQASSSEVFGNAIDTPQDESTPLRPRNPYGVAKAYAQWITANYREAYGLFAVSAILFNHESPRRALEFVTRKITFAAAKIKLGLAKELHLGDLEAKRDWGFAGDYVEAMWLILQQSKADDYVVATGETHSVREFCQIAFSHLSLNYQDYVVQDKGNLRRPESAVLVGNSAKAKRVLGWQPKVTFQDLVRTMVDADLKLLRDAPREVPSIDRQGSVDHTQNSTSQLGNL
jgi:GDPmannose 4,6-dehydratase